MNKTITNLVPRIGSFTYDKWCELLPPYGSYSAVMEYDDLIKKFPHYCSNETHYIEITFDNNKILNYDIDIYAVIHEHGLVSNVESFRIKEYLFVKSKGLFSIFKK